MAMFRFFKNVFCLVFVLHNPTGPGPDEKVILPSEWHDGCCWFVHCMGGWVAGWLGGWVAFNNKYKRRRFPATLSQQALPCMN